jgi:hypothetical protein
MVPVPAVAKKTQVRQSTKDFVTEEFTHSKRKQCRRCGLAMQFVDANFLLRGGAMNWNVSLPSCPVCGREILRDLSQAQTIHRSGAST